MKTQTGQILIEASALLNLEGEVPEPLKQSRKFCRVIRIQKKPFYGVLKQHKQFRVYNKEVNK